MLNNILSLISFNSNFSTANCSVFSVGNDVKTVFNFLKKEAVHEQKAVQHQLMKTIVKKVCFRDLKKFLQW